MRVLIIGRGYPANRDFMYGIFEYQQAKVLSNFVNVIYLALDFRMRANGRKYGLTRHVENNGKLAVVRVGFPCGRLPYYIHDRICVLIVKKLFRYIEKKYGVIDLIHVHFTEVAYITLKALENEKDIPIIITEHSSKVYDKNLREAEKRRIKYVYENVNRVVAVSNALKNHIFEKYGMNAICIHNMVDVEKFKFEKCQKKNIIVSVGNLVKIKRMDFLIKCFSDIRSKVSQNLIIIGDGPEKENLYRIIREEKLEGRVKLVGQKNQEEIRNYLNESDFFVSASEHETFGVACLEALASGIPVVATNSGGPRDYINDRNGIISSDLEMADAIKYMCENFGRYDGEFISKDIEKKFSKNSIAKEIIEVYKEMLNENKGKA